MLVETLRTFGRYNGWANGRLYDAVGALPEEDYRKQRTAAFFGSIAGTLNHILLVDRLWLDRLEGAAWYPAKLDDILYDDFAGLRAAREAEDDRICALLDGLSEASLARDVAFKTSGGDSYSMQAGRILTHVFNHQTHHRGQVHALLTDAGREPPALDLPYFFLEVG